MKTKTWDLVPDRKVGPLRPHSSQAGAGDRITLAAVTTNQRLYDSRLALLVPDFRLR